MKKLLSILLALVLLAGCAAPVEEKAATTDDAVKRVKELMDGGMSRKDAVKQAAQELHLPKNVVYDAALNI